MKQFHKTLFLIALLSNCWLGMQIFHELGHVVGAWITGGTIERVILHPLTISRTDVSPNRNPLIVVWLGPTLGCLLPLTIWLLFPKRLVAVRNCLKFFAGFCLVGNGAYLLFGLPGRVGDCGTMLNCGTNPTVMISYGFVSITAGFWLWHQFGSPRRLFSEQFTIRSSLAISTMGMLFVVVTIELLFFNS